MSIQDVTNLFPIPVKRPREAGSPSRITDIAVHHTAGFYLSPNATIEDELNHLAMIYQYHISRGFLGIGYHIVVFPSGRIYLTCSFSQWGANVYLENNHVLGISAIGTFDKIIPADLQLNGMGYGILNMWTYTEKEVPCNPHLYWGGTACPGKRHKEWVPFLADRARTLKEEDNMATIQEIVDNLWARMEQREQTERAVLEEINKLKQTVYDGYESDDRISIVDRKITKHIREGTTNGVSMTQVVEKVKELIQKVKLAI